MKLRNNSTLIELNILERELSFSKKFFFQKKIDINRLKIDILKIFKNIMKH